MRGHYCELFTCRDSFAILALNYATSLNRFVLHYVIKESFFVVVVVFLQPVLNAYLDIFRFISQLCVTPSVTLYQSTYPCLYSPSSTDII